MTKVSIAQAAKIKGVSISTLRRWEAEGKLIPERTPKGHRRYDITDLMGVTTTNSLTVGYARVSSNDQKADLVRQVEVLELFCSSNRWQYEIIQDMGSGLNYSKKGLKRLVNMITNQQVNRLVITNKDRLLRFGSEFIFSLCEIFGTEVVIINRNVDSSFEEELAQDVLEIITLFLSRLYGSRSDKNKQLVQELKNLASKL